MANESKIVVSIPNGLLKEIDRESKERGVSRGDFFLEAARHELGQRDLAQIDVAIKRGQVALAKVGSFDSADLLRADRAKRDARDRGR